MSGRPSADLLHRLREARRAVAALGAAVAADTAFERVRWSARVGPLGLLAVLAPFFLAPLGLSRIDQLDQLLDDRHHPKASTPRAGVTAAAACAPPTRPFRTSPGPPRLGFVYRC